MSTHYHFLEILTGQTPSAEGVQLQAPEKASK